MAALLSCKFKKNNYLKIDFGGADVVAAAEDALHDERHGEGVEDAVLLRDAPPLLGLYFVPPLQQVLRELWDFKERF